MRNAFVSLCASLVLLAAPALAQEARDPATLRFSDRAGVQKKLANQLRGQLKSGWSGPALDAVQTAAGLVVLDNARLAVARELGLSQVEVQVRGQGESLPSYLRRRFPQSSTFGQALQQLTSRGNLTLEGTTRAPKLPPSPLKAQELPADIGGVERQVDPRQLRFSQRSAGGAGRGPVLLESLRASGWQGPAVDVIQTPRGLVSIDNTRVALSQHLGIERIPVRVHQMGDALPQSWQGWRFGKTARTWGEALAYRTHQSGLGPHGTAARPAVPGVSGAQPAQGGAQPADPVAARPAAPSPRAAGEVRWVDPRTLRFSQRSAGGNGRAAVLRESLARQGWAGEPVDGVSTSRGVVTIDNTRVAVAQELGIERIPVRVHAPHELLPAGMRNRRFGGDVSTWGEALRKRTGSQRPGLPYEGTAARPRMPAPQPALSSDRSAQGQGFARVVRAPAGAAAPSAIPYDVVLGLFDLARRATLERSQLRIADARSSADARIVAEGLRRVQRTTLEIVETNDVLAEFTREGGAGKVRISSGLLNRLHERGRARGGEVTRLRALGLVLGHELAHAAGVRVERAADLEAVRAANELGIGRLDASAIKTTLDAFERPIGATRVDAFFGRLKALLSEGLFGRARALEAAAQGERDPYRRLRRADGTIDWRRAAGDRALREGGSLLHFGLALFLKELAVVAQTGERARIEEFFEGLLTTDFYKHYGLFVAGARAGELAYSRYLQRFVKPRFVGGLLRQNLALATGLALPQIVDGTFEGRAFAITLGSLGLSSAAVKAGVSSIRWVHDLSKSRSVATAGLRVGRWAKLGGWFYTAAELAVVLYLAEEVDQAVNAYLDERAARAELDEAGRALFAAVQSEQLSAAELDEAVGAFERAWTGWRNGLLRELEPEEARYAFRMESLAREAKLLDDRRRQAIERLEQGPQTLRQRVVRSHGSLEAYADASLAEAERELAEKTRAAQQSLEQARARIVGEAYRGHAREGTLLGDLSEDAAWLAQGATRGGLDPFGGRAGLLARYNRSAMLRSFEDRFDAASQNRLQTYQDQVELLDAALGALRQRRAPAEHLDPLLEARHRALETARLDHQLASGAGLVNLERAGDDRIQQGLGERLDSVGGR